MYSFAGLIRRTPPPTFSNTAITDRHSDTTISNSEHTGCGYPGLLDRKNRSDMCCRWESNPRLPASLSTRPGAPLWSSWVWHLPFSRSVGQVVAAVSAGCWKLSNHDIRSIERLTGDAFFHVRLNLWHCLVQLLPRLATPMVGEIPLTDRSSTRVQSTKYFFASCRGLGYYVGQNFGLLIHCVRGIFGNDTGDGI